MPRSYQQTRERKRCIAVALHTLMFHRHICARGQMDQFFLYNRDSHPAIEHLPSYKMVQVSLSSDIPFGMFNEVKEAHEIQAA